MISNIGATLINCASYICSSFINTVGENHIGASKIREKKIGALSNYLFLSMHTGPEVVNKSNFLHVNFDKFDVFTA